MTAKRKKKLGPKSKKINVRKQRLIASIQDDYERALMRGENVYAKTLKESLDRVKAGKKP